MGSSSPERTPQPLRGSIATGELRDNRREGLRRGKVKGKRCCSLEGGGACGQGGGPTDEMKQRARVWAAAHLLLRRRNRQHGRKAPSGLSTPNSARGCTLGSAHGSMRYDPHMRSRIRARGTEGSDAAATPRPSFALPPDSLPRQTAHPPARLHYAGRHDRLSPAACCNSTH